MDRSFVSGGEANSASGDPQQTPRARLPRSPAAAEPGCRGARLPGSIRRGAGPRPKVERLSERAQALAARLR